MVVAVVRVKMELLRTEGMSEIRFLTPGIKQVGKMDVSMANLLKLRWKMREPISENLNPQRNTELQNKEKHLKGGKRDLENQKEQISKLKRNLEQHQDVNKVLLDTQNDVKNLLEKEKDHLAEQLQDVETKREKNKEELKSVEKTITEREDEELLLGLKEELLQSQWKLDEEKKNYERHLLNIEKLLEPIEIQLTRIMKRKGDV
ncbi:hypothetical protein CRENBAI_006279 [Crenichthys baileyi]|uniref:Uncharacterized protein n=1 Tax=Crenichthys baileyi TaxID=28760 RepID=A0AAV9S177_9TELE